MAHARINVACDSLLHRTLQRCRFKSAIRTKAGGESNIGANKPGIFIRGFFQPLVAQWPRDIPPATATCRTDTREADGWPYSPKFGITIPNHLFSVRRAGEFEIKCGRLFH